MHVSKIFAITALLAVSAVASPTAPKPEKPKKPPPPPPVQQSNSCGNGVAPYCCDSDNGSYTTCYSLAGFTGTCSGTTVCCNANNSVQVCLGNVQFVNPPPPKKNP